MSHPSVRKGLITEPASVPASLYNLDPSVYIQDDHFPPDSFQDINSSLQQCFQPLPEQQQHQEQSPSYYYPSDLQYTTPPSSISSSPTFSSPTFSTDFLPAATTAAADYPASSCGSILEAPSMTPASSYNPQIHIEHAVSPPPPPHTQSQPQPTFLPYHFDTPMLAQHTVANSHSWNNDLQLLGQPSGKASPHLSPAGNTVASQGSQSRQGAKPATVSKQPLPTPVQTPVQNSFLVAPFHNYDPASQDGSNPDAEMAMRRAVIEHHQQQQQQHPHQHRPSDYSMAHSTSSVSHNSPVTPQTNFDDLDDASKALTHGEDRIPEVDRWMDEYLRLDALSDYGNQNGGALSIGVPKLNRTISDIYQDELYNPMIVSTPQMPKQASTNQNHLLNPYRNVFADRLHAANLGHMSVRSQSPATGMNRDRSPFQPSSQEFNSALQQSHLTAGMPMAQSMVNGEPKTISPKDALLDFRESDDSSMPPLFPSNQDDFNLGDALSLKRESSSAFRPAQNFSPMESFPNQYSTQAAGMRIQYPFTQQQQPARQAQMSQQISHTLPTMEPSRTAVQPVNEIIARPENTGAHEGTYTCTYHGCTLRFDTPAKLQKHKREAHRQTTPGGHLSGRDARNSQAGPHKCERINPSTGKPCNSIFSRPYDLTRHEDTIHNARKQKVRCHLCTEEKTFSRNDALTRHMRVVHPEVDWPGKQRRRGRE
ncbi:hypothetical protein MPDQ_006303 [Monascus purpureus]|uniref:C2H2-type domain-containing protein n=1 Tax=Monascus purpureus TaxID=5098 RepID=A0A507QY42_MONPU|nr:hypothetical protein MPDQ_006303 [Monascus purpureus]BDD64329.1 hypothetical protein MAP00_009158 [Monascus purpureus]